MKATNESKTKEELKAFLEKNENHFAAFLKNKRMFVSINGNKLIVEPKTKSFKYIVDYDKKEIYSTEKPDSHESTSYVEIGCSLRYHTNFPEVKFFLKNCIY